MYGLKAIDNANTVKVSLKDYGWRKENNKYTVNVKI